MHTRQTTALLTGIIVCGIVLLLSHLGIFVPLAARLAQGFAQHLTIAVNLLPSIPLQYAHHTAMAFLTAWVCLGLPRQGQRMAFILAAIFLTTTLSLVMALRGSFFEPFSSITAIILAGVAALLLDVFALLKERNEVNQYIADFRKPIAASTAVAPSAIAASPIPTATAAPTTEEPSPLRSPAPSIATARLKPLVIGTVTPSVTATTAPIALPEDVRVEPHPPAPSKKKGRRS